MAGDVNSQVLNRYYEQYKNTEISFSKEVIRAMRMDPRQIYVRSGGLQWSCIASTTSLSGAKIIIGTKSGAYPVLSKKDSSPLVSLRYSFMQPDGQLMSFFVSARVQSCQPYLTSEDLAVVQLEYTQRPPDDLIQLVGNLLDANANSAKRKEERIPINQDTMRKLGLTKKEMTVSIQNVPRNCILQNLSFGGAKIILMGLANFLIKKDVVLQLEFEDPHETITLVGIIVGTAMIEGRQDIIIANIQFAEKSVSLEYKMHINRYITAIRKTELNTQFADDTQQ